MYPACNLPWVHDYVNQWAPCCPSFSPNVVHKRVVCRPKGPPITRGCAVSRKTALPVADGQAAALVTKASCAVRATRSPSALRTSSWTRTLEIAPTNLFSVNKSKQTAGSPVIPPAGSCALNMTVTPPTPTPSTTRNTNRPTGPKPTTPATTHIFRPNSAPTDSPASKMVLAVVAATIGIFVLQGLAVV